jgi:CARDB
MKPTLASIAALALTVAATLAHVHVQAQPQLPKPIPNPQIRPINPDLLKSPLQRPDLTVMDIKPRMLGATPYAYVCIKNAGATATGPYDVELTMGAAAPTGSPPISWIQLVGKIRYPAMTAGTSYTCNDFKLPGNKLPNCVKFTARADSSNEIAESNEGNNTREHLGGCLGEPPLPASFPKLRATDLPPKFPPPGPLPRP